MALKAGAIRFNTDSSQMEIYDGNQWTGILATSGELETGGTRGIIFSGSSGSNSIEYITIPSTGDAIDFGNRTQSVEPSQNACGSRTRAFFGGGEGNTDRIEFVTVASTGDGTDFGDLTVSRGAGPAGASNATRAIWAGGRTPSNRNEIDYITMSHSGDAIDFGDFKLQRDNGQVVYLLPQEHYFLAVMHHLL